MEVDNNLIESTSCSGVSLDSVKNHLASDLRKLVKVEVCQSRSSKAKREDLGKVVERYIVGQSVSPLSETVLTAFQEGYLTQNVEHITISAVQSTSGIFEEELLENLEIYIYQMLDGNPFSEELEDDISAAQTWMLPSPQLHGLWGSLYYEDDIKENLLEYMKTTLLFSDSCVNPNIVGWNRLILLHGPPGTGKTSLCRALAHKLSIILSKRYKFSQLLEVNSHSLFSKWFSESGKLVLKMFQKIEEIVSNSDILVFVLIDEIESLTSSRQLMSTNEPTESIRVVNALLTQLDQIKRYPNILILSTSNMSSVIDSAFMDRVDIKQYIGLPGKLGVYEILFTCIKELVRVGIVKCVDELLLERPLLKVLLQTDQFNVKLHPCTSHLLQISEQSREISGRTLRKLPFLAHALYVQKPTVSLKLFLSALEKAVEKHSTDERNSRAKAEGV